VAVERLAVVRGVEVGRGRASLEELDRLWEEVKAGKDAHGHSL